MPRDAGGNYTLPPNNPVASGTVISSEWANPTMNDLGNEITNSLDRQGRGGMLVPFNNVDGTGLLPGITFTLDPGLGWWRSGTSDMRASAAAEERVRIYDDGAIPGEQRPFQVHDGLQFNNVLTDNLPDDITFQGSITALGGFFGDLTGQVLTASQGSITAFASPLVTFGNNIVIGGSVQSSFGPATGQFQFNPATGEPSIHNNGLNTTFTTVGQIISGTLTVVGQIDAPSGVNGNITGNAATADAAVAAGFVTLAAQPNITSVGQLTSINVTGDGVIQGNVSIGVPASTQTLNVNGLAQAPGGAGTEHIFQINTNIGEPTAPKLQFGINPDQTTWIQSIIPGTTATTLNLQPSGGYIHHGGPASFTGGQVALTLAQGQIGGSTDHGLELSGFGGINEIGFFDRNLAILGGFSTGGTGLFVTSNITAFSDIRLKKNLVPIGNALDKIGHLVGYTYDKDGHRNAGLVANDVQKVLPEAVWTEKQSGMLTLNDAAVTGLIINALNECREQLNDLAR